MIIIIVLPLPLPRAYLFAEAQRVQRSSIVGVLAASGHGLPLCSLLRRRPLLSRPRQTPFSFVEPEVSWELALPLSSWVALGKRVDFTVPVSSDGDPNSSLGAVHLKYLLRIQIPGPQLKPTAPAPRELGPGVCIFTALPRDTLCSCWRTRALNM